MALLSVLKNRNSEFVAERRMSVNFDPTKVAQVFGLPKRHFKPQSYFYFSWDIRYYAPDVFYFSTDFRILFYPVNTEKTKIISFIDFSDGALSFNFMESIIQHIKDLCEGKNVIEVER